MSYGFLKGIWVFGLFWGCSAVLTRTKLPIIQVLLRMSYSPYFQETWYKIFKFSCWLFGQGDIIMYLCKDIVYSNQIYASRNTKTFIRQFEKIQQFLFPWFFVIFKISHLLFFISKEKMKWWYNVWCLPHTSIYFMQNLIFKTNEWMYAFQKRTCAWCECNLKHLFSQISYTHLQKFYYQCMHKWENRIKTSINLLNLLYFIFSDFLSNSFFFCE